MMPFEVLAWLCALCAHKSPSKCRQCLNGLTSYCAHGRSMEKSAAQVESEWRTYGNIARLERTLERESNAGRRIWLEGLLKEQRELVATCEV